MDKLAAILMVLGLIVGVAIVFAVPVMLLWNWLMPVIFGLIKINIWQSLGLSLLSGFLFSSKSTSKG